MSLPRTYSVAEVAESLQVSEEKVRSYIARGLVNPSRIGTNLRKHWRTGKTVNASPYRFTQEDYDQLVAALRPAPVDPPRRRRRRAA